MLKNWIKLKSWRIKDDKDIEIEKINECIYLDRTITTNKQKLNFNIVSNLRICYWGYSFKESRLSNLNRKPYTAGSRTKKFDQEWRT